jgi:hypothetical protein
MQSIIFDHELLEKKIQEVKILALTLNESDLNSTFSKYPKHVFAPLEEYLNEAFLQGILKKGKDFADKFTKGAKEIATKVSSAVKEFSYKKVFLTVSKMMNKIKSKMLKSLMTLLAPLRQTIVEYGFCNEDNKFDVKATFRKLVSVAKEVGKPIGAPELLSEPVVAAMSKNINLEGTKALRESEEEEKEVGKAKFDEKDVKYLDFFQKMMFKLGIKDAKLNGFFSEISKKVATGAAITGVLSLIGALLPTAGIVSGIAAAAGAAVAAAPVLVMIIGAILFGIGLFMFATWLLKPYPTIENCRIFLGTIFSGAHPFDFPEVDLQTLGKNVKPEEDVESRKPAFDYNLINDLEEEGVEEDIPGKDSKDSTVKELKDIVKMYDDLDIDTIEDEDEVKDNLSQARYFVRNIFSKAGRDRIQDHIRELRDEDDDTEYTNKLEDFLELVKEIYDSEAIELENDEGKKVYPYALDYKSVRTYLKSKKNTVSERMTKVIDVTDNFIDRVEKKLGKGKKD